MTKKLLLSIAPVLALAMFAVMPALAQAQTRAYGTCEAGTHTSECPAGETKFKAFANGKAVKVVSKKAAGSGNFILEVEATGEKIECTTFKNKGTVENKAGIGHSTLTLEFDDCTLVTGIGKGCSVQTPKAPKPDEIIGKVTDEVLASGTEVKITVTSGFELETDGEPATCPLPAGTPLGTVKGTATGTQAAGSNVLVFTKAKGLFLGTEASNITGSDELETEATPKKKVVIN